MRLRRLVPIVILAALALPAQALAKGGSYVFDGGTRAEQAQVRAALDASAFDWGLVPATIGIHLKPGAESHALPGQIWLDTDLVDAGRFAWGPIQHEYAHQVDFFLLTPEARVGLAPLVGGTAWWSPGLSHAALSGERFASSLAWSFWPSRDNALRPSSPADEAGAVKPTRFRTALASLLAPGAGA